MRGLRIEIKTPVKNGPNSPILGWRYTNYFFTGLNKTTPTKVIGEHWFFDNDVGFLEAFLVMESFWEYCVRHNRTHKFDKELIIRYERVPLKDTVYTDKYQFVKKILI